MIHKVFEKPYSKCMLKTKEKEATVSENWDKMEVHGLFTEELKTCLGSFGEVKLMQRLFKTSTVICNIRFNRYILFPYYPCNTSYFHCKV